MNTFNYLKVGLLTAGLLGATTALAIPPGNNSLSVNLMAQIAPMANISAPTQQVDFGIISPESDGIDEAILPICLYSNIEAGLNLTVGVSAEQMGANSNQALLLKPAAEAGTYDAIPYTISLFDGDGEGGNEQPLTLGGPLTLTSASNFLSPRSCALGGVEVRRLSGGKDDGEVVYDSSAHLKFTVDMADASASHIEGFYHGTVTVNVDPAMAPPAALSRTVPVVRVAG